MDADNLVRVIGTFFIVAVPLILIFGRSTIRQILEHREKRMELEARIAAEKTAQYAAHNERLEQRVRVLERIVTDKGIDIADEIEQLRDPALPAARS